MYEGKDQPTDQKKKNDQKKGAERIIFCILTLFFSFLLRFLFFYLDRTNIDTLVSFIVASILQYS